MGCASAAYRAPASCYAAIKTRLIRHAVSFSDTVRPPGAQPNVWSSIDLRPYQDAALHAWELSGRRGIVALPTGSGKTRIAVAAMARTRLSTLCLVPTRVLLHQWLQAIRTVYPHAIGCLGDGERDLAQITVATFEAAYRNMERLGNRFDLLIVDECTILAPGFVTKRSKWPSPMRAGSYRDATARQGSRHATRRTGRPARLRAGDR